MARHGRSVGERRGAMARRRRRGGDGEAAMTKAALACACRGAARACRDEAGEGDAARCDAVNLEVAGREWRARHPICAGRRKYFNFNRKR